MGYTLLAGLTAVVLALVTFGSWPGVVAADYKQHQAIARALAAAQSTATTTVDPSLVVVPEKLHQAILTSLSAQTFPRLIPAVDQLGAVAAERDIWNPCETAESPVASCTYRPTGPSNGKSALVIGDSIAESWIPAIEAGLTAHGWTVYGYARGQCPAAFFTVSDPTITPAGARSCDLHHAGVASVLARLKPAMVILTSAENALSRVTGFSGHIAPTQYQAAMIKTVRTVSAPGRQVVILSPPPALPKALQDCDTQKATPAGCVGTITSEWHAQSSADRAAAQATHAVYLDSSPLFCASEYCPAFIGTTPVMYDTEHMTKAYSETLAGPIATALLGTRSQTKAGTATPKLDELQKELAMALLATSWRSRTIDTRSFGFRQRLRSVRCSGPTLAAASGCTFGSRTADRTVEVIGDSQAAQWEVSLVAGISSEPGWRVRLAAVFGCSFADRVLLTTNANASTCGAHNTAVIAEIERTRPDVVIVSNLSSPAAEAGSVANEIAKIRSYTHHVVLLGYDPVHYRPKQCMTPGSVPNACVTPVGTTATAWDTAMSSIAASDGLTWIDAVPFFCVDGYCPAFAGSTPMRYDAGHMSTAYAQKVAPVLFEELANANVFSISH